MSKKICCRPNLRHFVLENIATVMPVLDICNTTEKKKVYVSWSNYKYQEYVIVFLTDSLDSSYTQSLETQIHACHLIYFRDLGK